MPIVNRIADLHPEITAWRRDIHAHPELAYDVHRTAGVVAEKLRNFGCDDVVTGIGRTGVVGVIRGARTGSVRSIGLRADMDALPIEEATEVPYKSTVPGKMHAWALRAISPRRAILPAPRWSFFSRQRRGAGAADPWCRMA
jgi:hippurate hydrolase